MFRENKGDVEFLLVTSNSNRSLWIIPAGHIEAGETPPETALREVVEEAGVETLILSSLGVLEYIWYRNNQKILIETHLYLMKYVKTVATNPEGRQVGFFDYEQTKALNMWEESRSFLEKASMKIRQ